MTSIVMRGRERESKRERDSRMREFIFVTLKSKN